MKKQQYFIHTERAYIYYLDWQGEERIHVKVCFPLLSSS